MRKLIIPMLFPILITSCGNKQESIESMPVVAIESDLNTGKLITCDLALAKDTFDLKLSQFVEEPEVVQLDIRPEASIGKFCPISISDNYILIGRSGQIPCKLFDRKGKFIAAIGAIGNGPGEYTTIYDQQLDEKNKRIYLMPWNSTGILTYDFDGKFVGQLPLIMRNPKSKFIVSEKDSIVTVVALPFKNLPAIVYQQTMVGVHKQHIAPGHLGLEADFSNEVLMNRNTSAFDFFVFNFSSDRPDSLYHYNAEKNQLEAKFTTKFKEEKAPIHSYSESKDYFFGTVQFPVQLSENSFITTPPKNFLVNKESLKGGFFKISNDYLANYQLGDWEWGLNEGYYINNEEPMDLKEKIENRLKEATDIPSSRKEMLTKLATTLNQKNNNILLIYKEKTK